MEETKALGTLITIAFEVALPPEPPVPEAGEARRANAFAACAACGSCGSETIASAIGCARGGGRGGVAASSSVTTRTGEY